MVNAAYQRNMGVLGVLNSTPSWAVAPGQPAIAGAPTSPEQYAQFAGLVAQRYAGKVSAYEIWNEPNTYLFWAPKPDPLAYTRLLQAAYQGIKAADPNATVVGGVLISISDYGDLGINPVNYLQQMYDAGAAGNFDALSFHPYQYTLPFTQGGPYGNLSAINQMGLMHQIMVANGDGNKLIWSTEYGEPTSVVDEATQAAFIQDYLNGWSQIPYAGPSFIYTTRDRNSASTVADDTLGVLRDDWTWKPAASVIQQWTATHPQTPPPVTLTAATDPTTATATAAPATATVAPMAATAVPQSAVVAPTVTTAPATAATTGPATAATTAPATAAPASQPATAPTTAPAAPSPTAAATAPTGTASAAPSSGKKRSTSSTRSTTGSSSAGSATSSTG
jgi:hypothetical protein